MNNSRPTRAVIPAAGLGTRFLPWSTAVPKEMLPLIDRPVIDHVMEELVLAGITEVILVVSRGKEAIADHFDRAIDRGSGLTLHYVRQPEPRGLGDAVAMARCFAGNAPFALVLPDELYEAPVPALRQLLDLHERTGDPVLGLVNVPESEVDRYGVVDPEWLNDDECVIRDMVEKPSRDSAPSNTVICGRYVLTPDIFHKLEDVTPGAGGEIQLTDGMRSLLGERSFRGRLIAGERLDVGTIPAYLETVMRIALRHPHYGPELASIARQELEALPEAADND